MIPTVVALLSGSYTRIGTSWLTPRAARRSGIEIAAKQRTSSRASYTEEAFNARKAGSLRAGAGNGAHSEARRRRRRREDGRNQAPPALDDRPGTRHVHHAPPSTGQSAAL